MNGRSRGVDLFSVRADGDVVHLRLNGFWTLEDLEAYQRARRATVLEAFRSSKGLGVLILLDASDFSIQDSAIIDGLEALSSFQRHLTRAIAIVSDSALANLQAKPATKSQAIDNVVVQVFPVVDRAGAVAWLKQQRSCRDPRAEQKRF